MLKAPEKKIRVLVADDTLATAPGSTLKLASSTAMLNGTSNNQGLNVGSMPIVQGLDWLTIYPYAVLTDPHSSNISMFGDYWGWVDPEGSVQTSAPGTFTGPPMIGCSISLPPAPTPCAPTPRLRRWT